MSKPPPQSIADFIARSDPGGAAYGLNEEQGAQQPFIELCAVLGVAPPAGGDVDLFEKGALVGYAPAGQRRGYADVFKRGCFAWENKAPGKSLEAALRQLMTYALALDNPPLLVVSDRLRIEIPTQFNATPSERHAVTLRRRRRSLRLGGLHADHARRASPSPAARFKPRAREPIDLAGPRTSRWLLARDGRRRE